MPFATRERIWAELPPLDGEPEVKVEKKEVHEEKDGVDTVKTVEVRTSVVRKLKCVEERKTWKLFGLSEEDIAANAGMSESEDCSWEHPIEKKQSEKIQAGKKEFEEVKCRYCGGPHFSHACPHKNSDMLSSEEPAKPAERTPSSSSSSEKYSVQAAVKGRSQSSSFQQQEGYRVRVSNLVEEAVEDDIRELFGKFGRVTRCYIKKKYGGGNTGFAFVTFAEEQDALRACEKLNGRAYGHLILSVEMQKQK